ncbi:hypothetical protein [Cellulomonas sp. Y8]|uniref:hypothetical protein n=1 Tax=Cellulomonas sp. Y8 TaxID=2591145 RepID=UPI0011CA334E|nr:hypothetical protein [Cellulomonas sp. Y8]
MTAPTLRAITVGVAVCALAACTATPDPRYTTAPLAGDVPQFDGPWAAELTEHYRDSLSDLEREILRDGVITEDEQQALHDWYIGCMAGQGLSVTLLDNGGFDLGSSDQDRILAAESVCRTNTLGLAWEMRANPENVPPLEATHACLQRHGLLAASFTLDDFVRLLDEEADPSIEWNAWSDFHWSEETIACNRDPFDILGLFPEDSTLEPYRG